MFRKESKAFQALDCLESVLSELKIHVKASIFMAFHAFSPAFFIDFSWFST